MKFLENQAVKLITFVTVIGLVGTFLTNQVLDAGEKVKRKTAFEDISQIAKELQSPDLWLKNYLINHGVDTITASAWAKFPKEPPQTSDGKFIMNIPFLKKNDLPDLGNYIMLKITDTTVAIIQLDTLWNFREEKQ